PDRPAAARGAGRAAPRRSLGPRPADRDPRAPRRADRPQGRDGRARAPPACDLPGADLGRERLRPRRAAVGRLGRRSGTDVQARRRGPERARSTPVKGRARGRPRGHRASVLACALALLFVFSFSQAACRKPEPQATPAADVATLEKTRDELRARLLALRSQDPLLAQAPAADILVGLPVAFSTNLVRQ